MKIRIYDHSYHSVISGGDVIVAEFAKHWKTQGHSVRVHTHPEAAIFFLSRSVSALCITVIHRIRTAYTSVLIGSVAHIVNGTLDASLMKYSPTDVIFSASWSLQDLLPSLIDAWKTPRAKLVVGCYIFLEPPWSKAYGSTWVNRILFWLEYLVGITLTRIYADVIWTASPIDAEFIRMRWHKNAAAIRGGTDISMADRAIQRKPEKRTDAVYIGRFHPQKNMIELISIWKLVVEKNPNAQLCIAGAGFLENAMRQEIAVQRLTSNVTILPMIDNDEKFNLLAASKLFVSASHYDTGNLALDEALACSVPGIVYRLPKLVYPSGVTFIERFSSQRFADTILILLADDHAHTILSREAKQFASTIAWDAQSKKALDTIPVSFL